MRSHSSFAFAEVEDESNSEFGDPEVVEHLASLEIRDAIDRFCVNDNCVIHDKVGDKFAHMYTLVSESHDVVADPAAFLAFEFDDQRILIRLLVQSMSQLVVNLKRRTDDLEYEIAMQQFRKLVNIRVHSWFHSMSFP